jgi:hypothetical protein
MCKKKEQAPGTNKNKKLPFWFKDAFADPFVFRTTKA